MANGKTRMRILDAAGAVFAEKGFEAATIREICQSADVNLASVNYYFGDKQRLYIEAVRRARELRATQVPIPSRPAHTPPELRLRDFVQTTLGRMVGGGESWPARLLLREVVQPTDACAQLVEEYMRPHLELLLGVLDELLPANVPRWQRRQIAFSIIGQCLFYRAAGDVLKMLAPADELRDHFSVEQLAEHVAELSLAGIRELYGTRAAKGVRGVPAAPGQSPQ